MAVHIVGCAPAVRFGVSFRVMVIKPGRFIRRRFDRGEALVNIVFTFKYLKYMASMYIYIFISLSRSVYLASPC